MPGRADPLSRAVIDLLSDYASETFVTQTELARRTGITQSQISRLFSYEAVVTIAQAGAIARALGLSFSSVVSKAEEQINSRG